jgi:PAT family beta-lactamase induction signal transducer AmpG
MNINSLIEVFKVPKMRALLLLGFAGALPYSLTQDAFNSWLTDAKFDLKAIGWLGLISLPYSLKFLWSPFLDRFVPPLGRRRGWLAISQISLIFIILLMATYMPLVSQFGAEKPVYIIQGLVIIATLLAFLSATQDIAGDAYRTDQLTEEESGAGVAVWTTGYRLAILLTGWLGFVLADPKGARGLGLNNTVGWPWVYSLIAILMVVGLLTTFFAPEPIKQERPPETIAEAIVDPFREFINRLGWKQALFALIFIILYRLGDAMVAKMAVPFLQGSPNGDPFQGLGFSKLEIGNIRQGLGLFATIFGTLAGGAFLSQLGINRSLWIFGIIQAVSNVGYLLLAMIGKDFGLMVVAINVENFSGGLGTAGFLGFLTSLCNPRFSATQFALLSSLMAVGRDLIAAPAAGEIAARVKVWASSSILSGVNNEGWPLFFLITLIAALPGLILLPFFAPWNGKK